MTVIQSMDNVDFNFDNGPSENNKDGEINMDASRNELKSESSLMFAGLKKRLSGQVKKHTEGQ